MKKKNGFTLVEMLAVITLIAILMSVSALSVTTILNKNEQKLKEEMKKNLGSAAISYLESNRTILRKCSKDFDTSNLSSNEPSCYREIKVSDLLEKGFFTDNRGYCKKDAIVWVYKAVENRGAENEYSELRTYIKEETCN